MAHEIGSESAVVVELVQGKDSLIKCRDIVQGMSQRKKGRALSIRWRDGLSQQRSCESKT